MIDKEVLSHIRRPNPPWRDDDLTECGHQASEMASVISCERALALIKQHGKQRAAFLLCMTCTSTANRHAVYGEAPSPMSWERDPIAVLTRYLERHVWSRNDEARTRIESELRGIGALIEAHRDEFEQYVSGLSETSSLADARSKRRAR